MAETHGVTPRSLRNWKRIDPAAPRARPGRPALGEDVLAEDRKLVEAQLLEQGWTAGEEPIWCGLDKKISRARVRRALRELKADRHRRRAGHVRDARVSIEVLARDAVWSLDATHVGRDPLGDEVQAVDEHATVRSVHTVEDVDRLAEARHRHEREELD